MYVKKESEYQNNPVIKSVLEVLTGGATIAAADFNTTAVEELKAGSIVGKDTNGLFHVLKTAKIVAGGSASAPRIEKAHTLKVGDKISDGKVVLEINAITVGTTYDTLGFDAGSLLVSAAGTVLYQAETVDTAGGVVAAATVTDDVADTLTVTIPVASSPANFNGLLLVISQAADDNLAVSFSAGRLLIALAKTTASKNNAATIQTAVRALGVVGYGLDLSAAVVAGSAGWDGAQTGAVLTDASDAFAGGVNYATKPYLYTPVGLTLNPVDLTLQNQTAGVLLRGTVNETNMPQYVDANIKASLPLIRFE